MSEKNKKNSDEQQKEGAESKKKENGGGKNNVTVVLKADLHCEGCVSKVLKCIRSFDGVKSANIGDGQRITVVGKMDPAKLRERVEEKTHKKVELISPQPKKDDKNNNKEKVKKCKEHSGGDNAKQEKKKESKDKNPKNKSDEKKSKEKEHPVTTAVLKVHLHCEGCTQKIQKIIAKTKGYQDLKIDKEKELVSITGAIDVKALAEVLKKHLKRDVQIVPPKKEVDKQENTGGEKVKASGDNGKNSGGGAGDGGDKVPGGKKVVGNNRVQFEVGYPYPFVYDSGVSIDQFHYNPYVSGSYHAPQLFSDENPNACTVM